MSTTETEEEHRTNDVGIYAALVAALVVSLALASIAPGPLTITLIFVIAGFKAYLVLFNFIHLKAEPRFVKVIVITVLAVVVVLYFGLVQDITINPAALQQ